MTDVRTLVKTIIIIPLKPFKVKQIKRQCLLVANVHMCFAVGYRAEVPKVYSMEDDNENNIGRQMQSCYTFIMPNANRY